ncbi:rRNA methyltransferase, partial [Pseudomonas sp. FW305-47B]|uniref:tRNA (cytidine(34)-2'-O)-methyltransferase n=1 Tax=Pseudomonas sp. FW305-47B TaxID=2070558 RepID=UPI000CAF7CAF
PKAIILRHNGWSDFLAHPARREGRLVLLTTRGATSLHQTKFQPGDTLLFGRESAGVPEDVHERADLRLIIPIRPETRSLN